MSRDLDNLTPLDARNSLLIDRTRPDTHTHRSTTFSMASAVPENRRDLSRGVSDSDSSDRYLGYAVSSYDDGDNKTTDNWAAAHRPVTSAAPMRLDQSRDGLVAGAAPVGVGRAERQSTLPAGGYAERQPTVPDVGFAGGAYGDHGRGYANDGGGGYGGYGRGYV